MINQYILNSITTSFNKLKFDRPKMVTVFLWMNYQPLRKLLTYGLLIDIQMQVPLSPSLTKLQGRAAVTGFLPSPALQRPAFPSSSSALQEQFKSLPFIKLIANRN